MRPVTPRTIATRLAAAALLAALGACTTERLGPMPGASVPARPSAGPVPEMTGRWVLASPNMGFCGMNFGGGAGAVEGTIAPEGGCPGNFFTSRKWVFEDSALVIRDHTGQPLARRQRDHVVVARGAGCLARRIRIVGRPLATGALAQHTAQPQENEHCERQKDDGVDVEQVAHALGLWVRPPAPLWHWTPLYPLLPM